MKLSYEYIAGFVDADGSINLIKMKPVPSGRCVNNTYTVKLQVYSQNLDVLCDIRETIGGRIASPQGTRSTYYLYLGGAEAVSALKALEPFLRIKQEQARICIEFKQHMEDGVNNKGQSDKRGKGNRPMLSGAVVAYRESVFQKMKRLHHVDSLKVRRDHPQLRKMDTDEELRLKANVTKSFKKYQSSETYKSEMDKLMVN